MRSKARYPVDRYMVDSSKNIELVNIIGDDLWNSEPALCPEDEIMLRKLHDMLQSTSNDLKLLSGELSKCHEAGVQFKTVPTPLDEEFNKKVHIEELVQAKFHGYKIIEKPSSVADAKVQNDTVNARKLVKPKVINTAVQITAALPTHPKVIKRNLGLSRTKIVQINQQNKDNTATERLNNGKIIHTAPAVSYNEFSFNYVERNAQDSVGKKLQRQIMPSINIRSELKEQNVLNINILPDSNKTKENNANVTNVAVVSINHEDLTKPVSLKFTSNSMSQATPQSNKPFLRKVSKLSTCESSETSYASSDGPLNLSTKCKFPTATKHSSMTSARLNRTNRSMKVNEPVKPPSYNLEEWKRKLNVVYGTASSKKAKSNLQAKTAKMKSEVLGQSKRMGTMKTEYIPYSQLTLGGIRLSDIERDLSSNPNTSKEQRTKILDEILDSRENSRKNTKTNASPKVLTTSDENLLQEVIDIERTISNTISKNKPQKQIEKSKHKAYSNEEDDIHSYADDFEDGDTDNSIESKNEILVSGSPHLSFSPKESDIPNHDSSGEENIDAKLRTTETHYNKTFTKTSNLSIKDSVDIFEFLHSVDTQDIATQCSTSNKILPKETQTSPRNDRSNIQPIHNDLWPSIDPRGEIEKMLQLEKQFIKKLIIDEYGDILEKNIAKQTTSKESIDDSDKNVVASQKNTQTSPAQVKSVMTSPRRTKTRTTSPFAQQLAANAGQQTSPILLVTKEEDNIANHDITINLSSPRFNLRLPQNSRDALLNLDELSQASSKLLISKSSSKKLSSSSSSSVDAGSSSELSSLGEVRRPMKSRLKKNRVISISESSSSSVVSKSSSDVLSGGIIPLRSEGEISLEQRTRNIINKSDGEASFGII